MWQMREISSLNELNEFAENALFPSHNLIIRPFPKYIKEPIFKGIGTQQDLEAAFLEAQKISIDRKIWVEIDMRAHLNPTRMKIIGLLGEKLARRLNCFCPQCQTPGWGKVDIEIGLPCDWCSNPTNEIKNEIFGCTKCRHREIIAASHGKKKSDPGQCIYCNP